MVVVFPHVAVVIDELGRPQGLLVGDVTIEALKRMLETARPGEYEYQWAADYEYHVARNGLRHGFETIAASGGNAVSRGWFGQIPPPGWTGQAWTGGQRRSKHPSGRWKGGPDQKDGGVIS